jgi:uncharacterized protein YcbK (DUF882 family)
LIPGVSRVGRCGALAAIVLLLGTTGLQNAVANGDTRTLSFKHTHRDDSLTITYRRNGKFDDEALKKLNYFLRDWRTDEQTRMEPRLFDILWEVYSEVGGKEPINIISSYRSPQTNSMLRRRSRGVAKFSQHMLGHAIDFFIPGVPLEEVPSAGQPLKGYALALADVQKRGGSPSAASLEAAREGGVDVASAQPKRSFLASLFRGKDEDEDAEAPATTASAPVAAERSRTPVAKTTPAPMPSSRPTVVASASPSPREVLQTSSVERQTKPARGAEPPQQVATVTDIINSRGFWQGVMTAPPEQQTKTTGNKFPRWPYADKDGDDANPPVLAYSKHNDPDPAPKAQPMGASTSRATTASLGPSGLGTIVQKSLAPLRAAQQAAAPATMQPANSGKWASMPGARADDPWLRAVILSPSVQSFMTATVFGEPDYRTLRPHMQKPSYSVVMTFSEDPTPGMVAESFTGTAVAFQPTVLFANRTASLR